MTDRGVTVRILLIFVLTALLGASAVLPAQSRDENWMRCAGDDPDKIIEGCAAIIQSGQESNENLSIEFYNRGNAYDGKGEYDRAIQDYDQAIRLNPSNADAFNNRGVSYFHKSDYDRAIQDYDQAIHLNPNHATAFYNRGVAYKRKGDHDRAIQDFDQAIRLNPSDATAFNNRGTAYDDQGEYDRAIQDYDQAIRLKDRKSVG